MESYKNWGGEGVSEAVQQAQVLQFILKIVEVMDECGATIGKENTNIINQKDVEFCRILQQDETSGQKKSTFSTACDNEVVTKKRGEMHD